MDLIVARHKENIDWIDNLKQSTSSIDNVYVYNKFYEQPIQLPNIGRESHTYLHHIVTNYDRLNDINVFLQGDPFPHCTNLHQSISQLNTIQDIQPMNAVVIEDEFNPNRKHRLHPHGLFLAYFVDLLFGVQLDLNQSVSVIYGAQFACTKKAILNRPIEFYQFLLKFVSYDTHPIECYIFERLWLYIFDTNIALSNKYKMWI